jgi:hypothetical protein
MKNKANISNDNSAVGFGEIALRAAWPIRRVIRRIYR